MRPSLRRVLTAAAFAAFVASAWWLWAAVRPLYATDFYMYFVAARFDGRAATDDIYSADHRLRVGEEELARAIESGSEMHRSAAYTARTPDIVSSPFLYTCFTWLPGNYERALEQYHALQILCFALAVVILGAAMRLPWALTFLIGAVLTRLYPPVWSDTIIGNVNTPQLLFIAILIAVAPRFPAIGGAILGLLIAFKPNVAHVLVLLFAARIASRDWRRLSAELAGGAAGVIAAVVATAMNFGSFRVWFHWLPYARDFYERLPGRVFNNVAPALPIYERWGTSLSLILALAVIVLVSVLLVRHRASDALIVSAGVMVYLLTAPVVWVHYLVLFVAPCMVLLRESWSTPVGLLVMAAISAHPLLPDSNAPLRQWIVTPALLLVFAAILWSLRAAPAAKLHS